LDVPSYVVAALDTIDTLGLEVEGIFRVSGSVLTIRIAKETLNQGLPIDYSNYDIHSVAGVVQTWLRELPEPLMTYKLYPDWISSARSPDPAYNVANLKAVVAKLPLYNRFMLHHLCRFLNRVASFGKVNKMKSGNLSIVLGPSILAQQNTNMLDSPLQDIYSVVQCLIDYQKDVFEGVDAEREAFRQRIQEEKEAQRLAEAEEKRRRRAEIKRRRGEEESKKNALEQFADEKFVKEQEERRAKQREEREKRKQEKKEAEELQKRQEEEEEARRIEEERKEAERKAQEETLEKKRKEVEEIEKRYKEEQERLEKEEKEKMEKRRLEKLEFEERERQREQKEREQDEIRRKQEELALEEKRKEEERKKKEEEDEERKRAEERRQKALEALPKCSICKLPIEGEGISSSGHTWHKHCFVCLNCRKEIVGPFAIRDGRPVCGACRSPQVPVSNNCPVCRKELTGRVVRVDDKRIHKDCFKCTVCSGGLEDGYYEKGHAYVCENCVNK